MNNYMVAHLWANEKKESARGSNFFFEGESIYSYGYHFEVGRIVRNKRGEKAYCLTMSIIPLPPVNINAMFVVQYLLVQRCLALNIICQILVI